MSDREVVLVLIGFDDDLAVDLHACELSGRPQFAISGW